MYLLDWLTVFNKEQFLILRLEDHASNVKDTMHRVFQFLNTGMNLEPDTHRAGRGSMDTDLLGPRADSVSLSRVGLELGDPRISACW